MVKTLPRGLVFVLLYKLIQKNSRSKTLLPKIIPVRSNKYATWSSRPPIHATSKSRVLNHIKEVLFTFIWLPIHFFYVYKPKLAALDGQKKKKKSADLLLVSH